jgi:hypothetical protein
VSRRKPRVRWAGADELEFAAVGRDLMGIGDGEARRNFTKRRIRVPHLVAGGEHYLLVLRWQLLAVFIDVTDTTNVLDAPVAAIRDVTILERAESAAECELAIVIEGLTAKQHYRVVLHGPFDLGESLILQRHREIDREDFYTEIGMQGSNFEFHHEIHRWAGAALETENHAGSSRY